MTTPQRKNWADEDDDRELEQSDRLPERTETKVDKDGLKTVVEYFRNADGKAVKVTRVVKVTKKVVKVKKSVLERRNMKKFGDVAGKPAGPEPNITNVGDAVTITPKRDEEKRAVEAKTSTEVKVVCRNCGETGHWTLKCPKRNQAQPTARPAEVAESSSMPSESSTAGATGTEEEGESKAGKYVPPSRRAGAAGAGNRRGAPAGKNDQDDAYTLRVSNLSENTEKEDLLDLFRYFGQVLRVHVARDYNTNVSRGFAFVHFRSRDEAAAAREKLNGYGYDNRILHVDWAKPRDEK